MGEYTPTWAAVREGYAQGSQRVGITYERGLTEADAWLAAHDAKVKAEGKAEAWDEGVRWAHD